MVVVELVVVELVVVELVAVQKMEVVVMIDRRRRRRRVQPGRGGWLFCRQHRGERGRVRELRAESNQAALHVVGGDGAVMMVVCVVVSFGRV